MNREELLSEVRKLLSEVGFYVSDPLKLRGISFDLVARRDQDLMILKILQNIDSLTKGDADQLRALAEALSGRVVVIGRRSSSGELEDGIIYSRFGIPILSLPTLVEFLREGVPPFIFAAPGGLYVKIDSDLLRQLRKERNISLGTLAEIAGVSRKAIQMYEEGMGAVIEVAVKIEEFLKEPIVLPLDPFAYSADSDAPLEAPEVLNLLNAEIFEILERIGYDVLPVARCPFEAITSDAKILMLTGIERYGPMLERKAQAVTNISRVVERAAVMVTDRKVRLHRIGDTPLICRDDLKKAKDKQKILDLINERG